MIQSMRHSNHIFILFLFFLSILISKAFVSEPLYHGYVTSNRERTSNSIHQMSSIEDTGEEKFLFTAKISKRNSDGKKGEKVKGQNLKIVEKVTSKTIMDSPASSLKDVGTEYVSRRALLQGAAVSGSLLFRPTGEKNTKNGAKTKIVKKSNYRESMLTFETPEFVDTMPKMGRKYYPPLVPPLFDRPTHRYNLGRNTWALEQPMEIKGVIREVIRTIVVRMNDGRLWVLSPQWPTGEFCALLDELGPVAYVVLPTNAWEHAAPMKAFMKRYPQASAWVSPGQRGPFGTCSADEDNDDSSEKDNMPYPIDGKLPITTESPPKNDESKRNTRSLPPWTNEFEIRTMYTKDVDIASEAAFYHKPSKTLMITDAVIMFDDQKVPSSFLEFLSGPLKESSLRRIPVFQALVDTRSPNTFQNWFQDLIDIGNFDRIVTLHGVSPIKATGQRKLPDVLQSFLNDYTNPYLSCSHKNDRDWRFFHWLNNAIDDFSHLPPVKTKDMCK